jgi:hypothetical protein
MQAQVENHADKIEADKNGGKKLSFIKFIHEV